MMQSLLSSVYFQPLLFATIPQLHTPEVWTLLEQQGVIKELLSGETSEFQTKRGDANVTDGKCYSRYWNELKDNCNWKAHLRQGLPWLKRESNSWRQKMNENVLVTHTHPSVRVGGSAERCLGHGLLRFPAAGRDSSGLPVIISRNATISRTPLTIAL